jgi:hypothetical protein
MKEAQESSISPLYQTLLGRKIGTKASPCLTPLTTTVAIT